MLVAVRARRRPELEDHLALRVEDLSKIYFPEAQRMHEVPISIVDRMLGRRTADMGSIDDESDMDVDDDAEQEDQERAVLDGAVWGLHGTTFDVPRGAAVAVIGPPGAGKTTLLSLLGGVMPPTGGRALVRGRIWPPLSFLVNFMTPGVTVLQNLRMLARVADVPREALEPRLDEILELIGFPDRRTIRAMQKRDLRPLALAAGLVAQPDVMLIDTPSSFGPESFREATLPLFEELHARGTTMLLEEPPHELADALCDTALWLRSGRVVEMGPKDVVLPRYVAAALEESTFPQVAWTSRNGELRSFSSALALLTAVTEDANGEVRDRFGPDEPFAVRIGIEVAHLPVGVRVGLSLIEHGGDKVWIEQPQPDSLHATGVHDIIARLDAGSVPPGRYTGHVEMIVTASGTESTIGRSNVFAVELAGELDPKATAVDGWLHRRAEWEISRPLAPEL